MSLIEAEAAEEKFPPSSSHLVYTTPHPIGNFTSLLLLYYSLLCSFARVSVFREEVFILIVAFFVISNLMGDFDDPDHLAACPLGTAQALLGSCDVLHP